MAAAKLIPIALWAKNTIGGRQPHPNTLRNWVHGNKIAPPPKRIGRCFYVTEDARYIDPQAERLERMIDGR